MYAWSNAMRLRIAEHDQRDKAIYSVPVIDEETDKRIGLVISSRYHCRSVYLFDEKYKGEFGTYAECVAFVKGVESVLNHMVSGEVRRTEYSPASKPPQNPSIPEPSFAD
jgi:hypothetical protein